MDEVNPMVGAALASGSIIGEAEESDKNLHITTEQYAIAAGDHVVLAASESLIEKAFVAGEVLDPSDYQRQFPDWIERIQNGYMLLRWMSHLDHGGDLGWYARAKMLPVSKEQYDHIVTWLEGGDPNKNRPDFLFDMYEAFHDSHHEMSPETIGKSATCGECGSRDVKVIFMHTAYVMADASQIIKDGNTRYIPTGHHEVKCDAKALMCCERCEAQRPLQAEELKFERESVIGQIVNHPH